MKVSELTHRPESRNPDTLTPGTKELPTVVPDDSQGVTVVGTEVPRGGRSSFVVAQLKGSTKVKETEGEGGR